VIAQVNGMSRLFAVIKSVCVVASVAFLGCAPGGAESEDEDFAEQDSELSGVVKEGAVLKVTASALNLRSGPSTNNPVLEVLAKNEQVTCAADSGANGWVNVVTASGEEGWASAGYLTQIAAAPEEDGGNVDPTDFGTCSPERAEGAVGDYQKALHDSIAFAEGTLDYSKDGYNVLFGFKTVSSCSSHPNKCLKFGSSCSTAAGRYQFLNDTWKSVKSAKGLSSFEPENQERAGAYLIGTVRKVTVPQSRAMTASEFSNAMSKLSWEWASLPPGRYGQPNKSMSQMRAKYCSLAGC
jgi:muramidase (phage lysozyme)